MDECPLCHSELIPAKPKQGERQREKCPNCSYEQATLGKPEVK